MQPRGLLLPSVGARVVRILLGLEALGARGALPGLLDPCHGHVAGGVRGTGVGQRSGCCWECPQVFQASWVA